MATLAQTAGTRNSAANVASVDTIEIWLPRKAFKTLRDQGILRWLRDTTMSRRIKLRGKYRTSRKRNVIPRKVRSQSGAIVANIITVHAPSRQSFRLLDEICKVAHGAITRFDLAIDFHCDNPEAMHRWLVKHVVVKHRPKATRPRRGDDDPPPLMMHDIGETTYWHYQNDRVMRTRRELVCYPDRPSKITGRVSPHLELRIQKSDAVRRHGVLKPSDATRINPAEVFARNITLIEISLEDKERVIISKQRRAVADAKYTHDESAYADKYRAAIPRRIRGHVMRVTQDRAQEWRTFYGLRGRELPLDVLALPTTVTVPQTRPATTTGLHF